MQKRNLEFAVDVYSPEAIKKACYRFSDKFSAKIEVSNGRVMCELSFPPALTQEKIDAAISELEKEALDQELREHVRRETDGVRNLILAHAFSKTGLIKDE